MTTDIVIEPLQPAMAPEAARIMSIALMANPMTIAMWGGEGESQRSRMEKLIRDVNLAHPLTQGLVAKQGDRIVGATNWIEWPHCQVSFRDSLRFIPIILNTLRGATLRSFRLYSSWAKYDPHKPHRHLDMIGVLPEMQGQRIGYQLCAGIRDALDEQNKAGYLETALPGVVKMQEHFGFIVIGEIKLLGVHNWFMWREPQG
jgi:GNAT superfamily N-acetyltransferase